MKKIAKKLMLIMAVIILLTAVTFTVSGVQGLDENGNLIINALNFPDENFRTYISEFDTDASGILEAEEILKIEDINVYDMGISDLSGVEFFAHLKQLNCSTNNLKALDLTQNATLEILTCDYNQLEELDLSSNTVLNMIACGHNNIKRLDFSNNTMLYSIDCRDSLIEELEFGSISSPMFLYCQGNQLTELDLSGLMTLRYLRVNDNKISRIDLSQNAHLVNFHCGDNLLTSFELAPDPMIDSTQIFSDGNKPTVTAECNGTVDMSSLGNVSQMNIISGGVLDGDILTLEAGATQVIYEYSVRCKGSDIDSVNDHIMTVTMSITVPAHVSDGYIVEDDIHYRECGECGSVFDYEEHLYGNFAANDTVTYTGTCECGKTKVFNYSNGKINNGEIIEYGSYPQSKVTDSELLSALNALELKWNSYGYYSGNGEFGLMSPGDFMKYADIVYNGIKYRAVSFETYRPSGVEGVSGTRTATVSFQDDNGYLANEIYWFSFDPVEWRVIDASTGLVMCETVIDAQAFNNTVYKVGEEYWNNSELKAYANNYSESTIREWLNNDFYNTAFAEYEKIQIKETDLSVSDEDIAYGAQPVSDFIFLLSYEDVTNSEYGFSADRIEQSSTRTAYGSDYAKCQGLYVYQNSASPSNGCSNWRLRSAGSNSFRTRSVNNVGSISFGYNVSDVINGIRPAMKLHFVADSCMTDTDLSDIIINQPEIFTYMPETVILPSPVIIGEVTVIEEDEEQLVQLTDEADDGEAGNEVVIENEPATDSENGIIQRITDLFRQILKITSIFKLIKEVFMM